MVRSHLLASSFILPAVLAAGFYDKSSPVINLDAKSYNTLIAPSDHVSIVEFYAPWCGHCQSLKPAYEKAAKSLAGLAKVAAVNCDEDDNKPFCGSMEVKGFPTLKIIRPNTKNPGSRPIVEDYQGARSAKGIVDAVVDKIPNHVVRPKKGEVDDFIKSEGAKAILFSDKGLVSPLLKSLAINYLGVISFAQIVKQDTAAVQQFDIKKYPTLLLFKEGSSDPITYEGEIKREDILDFLKTAAEPNLDPPKRKKVDSKTNKAEASKDSSSFSQASASQASSEASNAEPSQTAETIVDDGNPLPSVDPKVSDEKPVRLPLAAPKISSLPDGLSLQQKCLNNKASTCILLLLPETGTEDANSDKAVTSLSEVAARFKASGRTIFPFYQLPSSNSQAAALRTGLKLNDGIQIVATNGKRTWWRQYERTTYDQGSIDDWIDALRMGEGAKKDIPDNVIVDFADLPPEEVKVEPEPEPEPAPAEYGDEYERVEVELKGGENGEGITIDQLRNLMPQGMKLNVKDVTDEEYVQMQKEKERERKEKEGIKDEL